jgi:hypothetical protein
VPALKRARDLICGTLATLPLHATNANGERVDNPLLVQPESLKGLVRTVTVARTLEDLWYDSASLWMILQYNSAGFPTAVERIEFGQWTQDESGTIWVRGNEVKPNLDGRLPVILFVSPNDPMLEAAAVVVRMAIRLSATSDMYADNPSATEYFTPSEGQDPDDADIQVFLTAWNAARKARSSAFIPAGIERHEISMPTADEIQLIGSKEWCVKEVSNLTGIDPSWLAVNQTTRSYTNEQDIRRAFIELTCASYIAAFEQRLSLGDVTPRGTSVHLVLDGFLRANTKERYDSYLVAAQIGQINGVPPVTGAESRELENRPSLNPEVQ